jgi:desulfoferrodoxin (superoxide reductase-like protein)
MREPYKNEVGHYRLFYDLVKKGPLIYKPSTGGNYMKRFKISLFLGAILMIGLHVADTASANIPTETIEAPQSAVNGSEITIRVTVVHNADNIFHHVDWFSIMVNGKEVGRWEYSWGKLPPDTTFAKEIKYTVNGPLAIKAQAHCNIHGSKAPVVLNVTLK